MATGTVTLAKIDTVPRVGFKAYVIDWICDASGDVLQSISDLIGALGERIIGLETVPGLNGDLTTQLPTNLYDITLIDEYGTDVVAAALMNRSGTVGEKVNPAVPIPVVGALSLVVDVAGITLAGRLIIYTDRW